ncbi:ABC transporter substrate-binding protein [Myroides sp. LJL119]
MKSIIYYISIICVVLFILGCENKTTNLDQSDVFRYNESSGIATLDPAFARSMSVIWPSNQIFNSLVGLNDSLHIIPDVAHSWKISPDAMNYDFFLKDDVYFHKHENFGKDSTRAVVAGDFVFSLNRLKDPDLASPGAWIMQYVDKVQALNDTTVRISLKEPFPGFLGLMSMRYASVVPKEIIEDKTINFRTNPIGTGPFYVKYWQENVKLVLRSNPNYFEKDSMGGALPYLKAVAISFLPDKQSVFLQFIQGKLDFISGIDPSYKDDIITKDAKLNEKYASSIKMTKGPYLNTEYLGFNLQASDLGKDHQILRNALNIGFDRNKMLLYLRNGLGNPQLGGAIPAGLEGNIEINESYHVLKAKELVDKYKQINNLQDVTLELATDASYVDIAQYLQREWKKIGVNLKIDVMPSATLRQALASGKVSFFRASWIADYPEAQNYMSLFYSENKAPNGPNYTRFEHSEFDKLYLASIKEIDKENRIDMYKQMDHIIAKQVPIIVLYYDQAVRFSRSNVHNLGINPMNNLFLKTVYKTSQ